MSRRRNAGREEGMEERVGKDSENRRNEEQREWKERVIEQKGTIEPGRGGRKGC